MISVFISYRRSDAGGHTGRLVDRLRAWYPEEQLFFDVRSIDFGSNFPQEIEDAVTKAKAMLIVIGPDWLQTLTDRADTPHIDLVRREVSVALQRRAMNQIEILPILVGGAKMPKLSSLRGDLKEDIGQLMEYQALEFLQDDHVWDLQFERLRGCLARVEGIPRASLQTPEVVGGPTLRRQPAESIRLFGRSRSTGGSTRIPQRLDRTTRLAPGNRWPVA